jgi:hypothetical protein
MKNLFSVLVIALISINVLNAQTTEALTNSTIIKMVKAKLSDDLILDEINNSKVNFSLSPDSIKILSEKSVSSRVIEAMKNASGLTTSVVESTIAISSQRATEQLKDTLKVSELKEAASVRKEVLTQTAIAQNKDTLNEPVKAQLKSEAQVKKESVMEKIAVGMNNTTPAEKASISVDAVSYVIPLQELMTFFDIEFNALAGVIEEWDKHVRNSIDKGNQIKEKILLLEKELADKKNADSKGFTPEIILLKSTLSQYRESYKEFKNSMVTEGLGIVKEIENIGSKSDQSINKKFGDISQVVKKRDPEPSVSEIPKSITISDQKISDNIVYHIAPVTEILYCYKNQIVSIRDIIERWNVRVTEINKKDAELSRQFEPLNKELISLQQNPKVNKAEISALKKQCANIDKERKLITKQMRDDSKELSGSLAQICKEVQSSVEERFKDIIEDIKYSYQDNYTYRDI